MALNEEHLKALMIRGLEGDAAAHRQLLADLARLLRGYYRRRMPHMQGDVEDTVQEALIAIHQRRASYDRDRAFTAWAISIARYKMIDVFRKRAARPTAPLEEALDLEAADGFASVDDGVDLGHMLALLPSQQREAIQGVKIDGLSVAETAVRTGLSPANVKISIHRGMKKLFDMARKEGSDENG